MRPIVMRLLLWGSAVSCRGDEIKMLRAALIAWLSGSGGRPDLEKPSESRGSLPRDAELAPRLLFSGATLRMGGGTQGIRRPGRRRDYRSPSRPGGPNPT